MIYATVVLAAAKAAKVSGALLLAICVHETNLNNIEVKHDGGSPTYGICQVKLGTAQMLGYKGDAKGLMDPATNAKWAAQYLKYQQQRYNHNLCKATAAYNSGTYNESVKVPGLPKNFGYVKKVQSKLDYNLRYLLTCKGNEINSIVSNNIWETIKPSPFIVER